MLHNRLLQNKYKLMALVLCLCLLVDMVLHKGLVRVMVPKKFPDYRVSAVYPNNNNTLINTGKAWVKAVNTIALMNSIHKDCRGLECDIYFDLSKSIFEVHHDEDISTGLNLDDLLQVYRDRGLKASIWFDFKNLDETTAGKSLSTLSSLRNKYALNNKILVESSKTKLLKIFSDSGFFTSYYTPMFNPYLANEDSLKHWVDSLSTVIRWSSVNAISGYYFQYPFLHRYFPDFPILIWSPNDRFSLVNMVYKQFIANDKSVFIALYP